MINIAVMGYGTVGSGVYEVIRTNQDMINKRAGEDINVKYVLDLRDFPGDPVESVLTHDFDTILNDDEVKIVVEVMGGVEPAYTFVKKLLLAKKSVCTSNKELVAKHGPELIRIAKDNTINFLFEASVGGGIPIIRPLNTSLTADKINEISGILNGTTNYILTRMTDEGWDFDSALKKAQELGYAERNPEADIEGYDACRKIAILTSLACEKTVSFEDIYTEGISKITVRDIQYARKMGRNIKLLASSVLDDNDIYAMVAPFMVPSTHPLYSISGVFNAIFVKGNMVGDTMFYGSGAGKLPTASAVVGDVVDAARNLNRNMPIAWRDEKCSLTSLEKSKRFFFVRVSGTPGARFDDIAKAFKAKEVIELEGVSDEFGFITSQMSEKEFADNYASLEGAITRIRLV